jgi:hypothetical protein
MKSAPRRAENVIALLLSEKFAAIGASEVVRIPVIGRTGPDITINEVGLVVDVKNRKEVPNGLFHDDLIRFGDLLAAPIEKFELLVGEEKPREVDFLSVTVLNYYTHMHEWTMNHRLDGIACVILHKVKPAKMPFGKSMVIISFADRRRLQTRWKTQ